MTISITIEKHPLKDFTPSRYCEWCFTISTDDPNGFPPSYQWALDFPPDTDILDPKEARKIKGAPKYYVDPDFNHGTFSKGGEKDLKICIVAACADREGTDLSLERRYRYPQIPVGTDQSSLWEPVPWEDAPNGVGKIVGPGALASARPPQGETIAALATFEAWKLGALIGVSPKSLAHTPELPTTARRIFVSGATAADDAPQKREPGGRK